MPRWVLPGQQTGVAVTVAVAAASTSASEMPVVAASAAAPGQQSVEVPACTPTLGSVLLRQRLAAKVKFAPFLAS